MPRTSSLSADPSSGKLACLDGLRGIAILLVILFHFSTAGPRPYHPAVAAVLAPFSYGFSGVHLFLVLSGFCLTHSLIGRSAAGRAPTLRAYLGARWRRIAPPYYAAMAIYLAVPAAYLASGHSSPLTEWLSVKQIASHLTFLHGYWPDTIHAINTPFWSLSLEFQFYLAFPLLFAMAGRLGVRAVILLVAATSLAWRAFVAGAVPDPRSLTDGIFLGRWTEFAFGMGVAAWYNAADRRAAGRLPWGAFALGFLALAVVGTRMAWTGPADFLFGAGYASLLVAALQSGERGGRLGNVLSLPYLVAIGVVSYSLYLTHSLFQERGLQLYWRAVPKTNLITDIIALATISAAIGVGGWLFHRFVERRFLGGSIAVSRAKSEMKPVVSRSTPSLSTSTS